MMFLCHKRRYPHPETDAALAKCVPDDPTNTNECPQKGQNSKARLFAM